MTTVNTLLSGGQGAALPTGAIGEKLSFTARTVSTNTSTYTANTNILVTIPQGSWLLLPYFNGSTAASLAAYQGFLSTNSNNDGTGNIGVISVIPASASIGFVSPILPVYYTVTTSTNLYAKAASNGASGSVEISGFAIRLA